MLTLRDTTRWATSPFYLKDGKLAAKNYSLHGIDYLAFSPYDSLSHAFSLMDPPSGPVDPGFYAAKLAAITKLYYISKTKYPSIYRSFSLFGGCQRHALIGEVTNLTLKTPLIRAGATPKYLVYRN